MGPIVGRPSDGPAMLPPVVPTPVQFEFPNETSRELPSTLRARLSDRSNLDDIGSNSARAIDRAKLLREQHIAHRVEVAARETQRGEDAAARKRRRAAARRAASNAGATLEKDASKLELSTKEAQQFDVDPLFHKMSRTFDEARHRLLWGFSACA